MASVRSAYENALPTRATSTRRIGGHAGTDTVSMQAPGGWDLPDAVLAAYEHILLTDDWSVESLASAPDLQGADLPMILDALVAARLIRPSQEALGELSPVAPAVGLRDVVDVGERELLATTIRLHQLRARAGELEDRFTARAQLRSRATFEELHGQDSTLRRISEVITGAERMIDTVVSTLPSAEALQQARYRDVGLIERGIRIRAIYLEGHRKQSRALRDYLDWLGDLGAEVRIRPTLPTRLLCVDNRTAVVAIQPTDPTAGAIVVHTPGLVATVSHLFDLLWSSSRYPQDSQSPGTLATSGAPDFDDLERTVLRLLASGHKDEAVARRVGLSLRSVRRVIGSISAQLGTSSRFELGVRCHDLGLTSLDPRPDPASLGSRERGAPGLA